MAKEVKTAERKGEFFTTEERRARMAESGK
jgi:hypothetical protein